MSNNSHMDTTNKTTDKILNLLKANGEMSAKELSDTLGMTTMGARQHLKALEEREEVVFHDKPVPRGRPTRYWSLTQKSQSHFDDRHEELTVQLITAVKDVFGDVGLDQLIGHREQSSYQSYTLALDKALSLIDKLKVLAEVRTQEGYMATVEEEDDGTLWLMENHCPICAAAKSCLNFCRSELALFQRLFDGLAVVSREEYMMDGARRCAYKVKSLS